MYKSAALRSSSAPLSELSSFHVEPHYCPLFRSFTECAQVPQPPLPSQPPLDLDLELVVAAAAEKRRPSTSSVGSTDAGSAGANNWILNARSPLALGARQDSLPYLPARDTARMRFRTTD